MVVTSLSQLFFALRRLNADLIDPPRPCSGSGSAPAKQINITFDKFEEEGCVAIIQFDESELFLTKFLPQP